MTRYVEERKPIPREWLNELETVAGVKDAEKPVQG